MRTILLVRSVIFGIVKKLLTVQSQGQLNLYKRHASSALILKLIVSKTDSQDLSLHLLPRLLLPRLISGSYKRNPKKSFLFFEKSFQLFVLLYAL